MYPKQKKSVCSSGRNDRARWLSTATEAGAGRRAGAGGHREIHTGSISAENGQSGERDRGSRGWGSGHGSGGWQDGRESVSKRTRPSPGATAGEQAGKDQSSTTAWHKTTAENKKTPPQVSPPMRKNDRHKHHRQHRSSRGRSHEICDIL